MGESGRVRDEPVLDGAQLPLCLSAVPPAMSRPTQPLSVPRVGQHWRVRTKPGMDGDILCQVLSSLRWRWWKNFIKHDSCTSSTFRACLIHRHSMFCLWASIGECTQNPAWMATYCAKSCQVCDGGDTKYFIKHTTFCACLLRRHSMFCLHRRLCRDLYQTKTYTSAKGGRVLESARKTRHGWVLSSLRWRWWLYFIKHATLCMFHSLFAQSARFVIDA
jgi:hypothetical protein